VRAMTDPKLILLGDRGLGFFGAISASLSHDLNNVLATVSELGGLLEELVDASEHGRPLDPARLKRTLGRIPAQVKRGQAYVKQLNCLAHSVDHDHASVDLGGALREVIALCERFARLREVRIESTLPDVSLALEGRPFDLMHLIYRCVEITLAASSRGSSIHISFEALGQGAIIVVTGEAELEDTAELRSRTAFLEVLVEAVGGTLQLTSEPGRGTRVAVELPRVLRTRITGVEDVTR
jgi:signal transduction histidine kinase